MSESETWSGSWPAQAGSAGPDDHGEPHGPTSHGPASHGAGSHGAGSHGAGTAVSIRTASIDDEHFQPLARHPERTFWLTALTLFLGVLATAGFGAAFWVNAPPWVLAVTFGGGLTLLGAGLTSWGKYLMPKGPFMEERHSLSSTEEERDAMAAAVVQRGGIVIKRRGLLGGLLAGGLGIFALGAGGLGLRSLGPLPKKTLQTTNWKKGSLLVDSNGRPIHRDDVAPGGLVTVFPDGFQNADEGLSQDQTVLIRFSEQDFTTQPGRETWGPAGYLAYSKLCTHLACPVGLYEQQLELLVCPCHQSMFNPANGCIPEFGPAPRPLPQLALYLDGAGLLRAQGPYDQPVGPGFWERTTT